MIQIGKIQTLKISEENNSGYKLSDAEGNSVFLPGTVAPKELVIGNDLEVFIYTDNQGGLLATPEIPHAEVDSFAYLKVKSVTDFGYFFDWGISKDLLMPGNQRKEEIRIGSSYLVRVCLEAETNRIFATQKFGKYLESENIELHPKQKVEILPYQQTPLGFKVIIENKYSGMIYHNEIFSEVALGEPAYGYIKRVRPDKLVDVSLQPLGMAAIRENFDFLYDALKEAGGFLPITTYSSPEEIYQMFGISKLAFKKAFTALFKAGRVEKAEGGIKLVEKSEFLAERLVIKKD